MDCPGVPRTKDAHCQEVAMCRIFVVLTQNLIYLLTGKLGPA